MVVMSLKTEPVHLILGCDATWSVLSTCQKDLLLSGWLIDDGISYIIGVADRRWIQQVRLRTQYTSTRLCDFTPQITVIVTDMGASNLA